MIVTNVILRLNDSNGTAKQRKCAEQPGRLVLKCLVSTFESLLLRTFRGTTLERP